jgi:hypothetical protein
MFVVVQFGVVFLLYCVAALFVGSYFATLFVGFWVVTNVTFTALYVGSVSLFVGLWALLYNLLLFNKALF